jgi:hypothetical protein
VWFTQAEAQFSLAGIRNERTKFHYVISQLDHKCTAEVEDIIISPPRRDLYSKLRTELLKRLSLSKEQCAHRILTLKSIGKSMDSNKLQKYIEELSRQVVTLSAERD